MEYFKATKLIRSEVKNNYVYVRDLEKGGVIDALLTDSQVKKVSSVLQQITDESFTVVWDLLKSIKGVKFTYSSY